MVLERKKERKKSHNEGHYIIKRSNVFPKDILATKSFDLSVNSQVMKSNNKQFLFLGIFDCNLVQKWVFKQIQFKNDFLFMYFLLALVIAHFWLNLMMFFSFSCESESEQTL